MVNIELLLGRFESRFENKAQVINEDEDEDEHAKASKI